MSVTITKAPAPTQQIEATCSVDPEIDSLSVVFEDGKFWFRAKRRNRDGSTSDYVSVTLNPDEAATFAGALVDFVEEVEQS